MAPNRQHSRPSGRLAGLFSGLFGVGGGIVIVPLLVLWLGFGEREATGTSLAAIVLIAGVATAVHGAYGNVHLREGVLVGAAGRRGRHRGHRAAAPHLDPRDLADLRGAARRGRDRPARAVIEAMIIGLAAGVVAGLLGVGGGALFVPALTIGLGLSQIDAEATSLLAIIPVALVGAWRQRSQGNVDVRVGLTVGVLAAGGAAGGAALANALPERALEVGFAILLLFVAAQLVRRAFSVSDAR